MSGRRAASASAPSGSPGGATRLSRSGTGRRAARRRRGDVRVAGGRNRVRQSRTVVTGTAVSRATVSLWSSSASSRRRAYRAGFSSTSNRSGGRTGCRRGASSPDGRGRRRRRTRAGGGSAETSAHGGEVLHDSGGEGRVHAPRRGDELLGRAARGDRLGGEGGRAMRTLGVRDSLLQRRHRVFALHRGRDGFVELADGGDVRHDGRVGASARVVVESPERYIWTTVDAEGALPLVNDLIDNGRDEQKSTFLEFIGRPRETSDRPIKFQSDCLPVALENSESHPHTTSKPCSTRNDHGSSQRACGGARSARSLAQPPFRSRRGSPPRLALSRRSPCRLLRATTRRS